MTGRGSSQASRDFQVTAELWKFSLTTKSAPCSLSRFTSFSPKAFGGESLPNLQDNFSTAQLTTQKTGISTNTYF